MAGDNDKKLKGLFGSFKRHPLAGSPPERTTSGKVPTGVATAPVSLSPTPAAAPVEVKQPVAAPAAAPAPVAPVEKIVEKTRPDRTHSVEKPANNMQRTPSIRLDDAKAAWQPRPRMPSRLADTYVNFMVIGESGLGKTTFINNLTQSYEVESKPAQDGSHTTLNDFQADPYALRTTLAPMDIPESSRRLMVSIQDMPGWGDDINLVRYLRVVTGFILEQRQKDYEKLAGSRAMDEFAMCGQLANSITACLYFVAPHRMKKIDLILMAAVSQLVTVIPIIAKADTMTERELAVYRKEVMKMLANPSDYVENKSLPQLEVSLFSFAEQILSELGVQKSFMPVAVVTSRDFEEINDPTLLSAMGMSGPCSQPVRRYKWGDCYPLNRDHSDLILLKRLLLGDQVESLYAMLDDSYHRYVGFCAAYEEAGKQLQLVVHDYCSLSCPHLEYDDYAKAKQALDSAKLAMSALSDENKNLAERLQQLEKEKKTLAERARAFSAGAQ